MRTTKRSKRRQPSTDYRSARTTHLCVYLFSSTLVPCAWSCPLLCLLRPCSAAARLLCANYLLTRPSVPVAPGACKLSGSAPEQKGFASMMVISGCTECRNQSRPPADFGAEFLLLSNQQALRAPGFCVPRRERKFSCGVYACISDVSWFRHELSHDT